MGETLMAIVREIKKRNKSIICYIIIKKKENNCFPFLFRLTNYVSIKTLIVEMKQVGCNEVDKSMNEMEEFDYTVEQFADLQLLRYKVYGFEELSLKQKKLIYYLSQAALQGRDILFDQNGKYNLLIRKMLETVYTEYQEIVQM